MTYGEAVRIIGEAVENPQANVTTQEIALATATVLVRTGMLGGLQLDRLRIVDETIFNS